MRVTIQVNEEGESIMIFPKSAPLGLIEQIRRVTNVQREFIGKLGNLVFVLAD